MKIIFVAPNPANQETHEGFLHRVIEIDNLFDGWEKVYLEDIKQNKIAEELKESDVIYVHSIYQADKIRYLYRMYGKKIITDLHGVVPEEEMYMGNPMRSKYFSGVEEDVFKYGRSFVSVTEAMKNHFCEKYKLSKKVEWIILPIFDSFKKETPEQHALNVIYAGGTQKWQNVPKIVEAINARKDISATILTYDAEAFKGVDKKNRSTPYIIKSVKSSEVGLYYSKSTFGFVIRDNTIVNRVACPTKLIEYLSYGVVPIVDNADIGDFKALGYKYLTLKDFMNDSFSLSFIKAAQIRNTEVIEKLKTITDIGKSRLMDLVSRMVGLADSGLKMSDSDFVQEIATLSIELSEKKSELLRSVEENNHLRKKVQEYASSVDFLTQENESMRETINNKTKVSRGIIKKIISLR